MNKKLYTEKRFDSFREIIDSSAHKYGKKAAFIIKEKGGCTDITYACLRDKYYSLCGYFSEKGFTGKPIAIVGANCFEWVLCYLAAATVGIAVPIDRELNGEDICGLIEYSECVAVCYAEKHRKAVTALENKLLLPFSDVKSISSSPCTHIQDVLSIKKKKDEMSVLIFTSGTTGSSKGVCLSQDNICANIHSTVSVVKITSSDRTLSLLPLHHTYECTLNCLLLLSKGACITYCDGLSRVANNLIEYSPTVLVAVPAVLQLLVRKISRTVARECPKKYSEYFENLPLGEALRKTPFIIRKIIVSKIRKSLGSKMRLFIVGAADLDTSIIDDFAAVGIRTLQGYGLTECSPLLAGNSDFFLNTASTGIAMPGVELKLHNPNEEGIGEIIAKGENIMLGYFRDEEATKRVLRDGWFHTGDLGQFGKDMSLYIKGRIKNVIVTSNGKNIYPEELENRLSKYPVIGEALVCEAKCNDEITVKAKILPNTDVLKSALGRLPTVDEIKEAIDKIIEEVNEKIPSYKNIRVVEILSSALEKTTTQKIKRCGANLA